MNEDVIFKDAEIFCTHLFPCKVRKFVSVQVAEVPVLRRLFHHELDVCRRVVRMRDVNDLGVDRPAEAFLHREVEALDGDELGHDAHRDVQVLHCRETVADIHREGVGALKETDVQTSYRCAENKPRA